MQLAGKRLRSPAPLILYTGYTFGAPAVILFRVLKKGDQDQIQRVVDELGRGRLGLLPFSGSMILPGHKPN